MIALLKRVRWKTLLFGAVLFIIGLADFMQAIDLSAVLLALGVPEGKVSTLVTLSGAGVMVLRFLTTQPWFTKGE